jgi:glycosyltransferase involved in cell wall biosynthesis
LVEVEKNRSIEIEVEAAKVKPFVVVGIQAFNEERTIAKVVLELQRFADKVVVCDDGSSDMTAEIAERLGADVARHERNLGYGAAIQSLFKHTKELDADVFVTLDADGQHDPSEIPLLVEPVLNGKADVVIGSRFLGDWGKRNSVPRHRRVGIKVITKLTGAASNHRLSDAQSGFRVYGRKALESLSLNENGMGLSVEILMEAKKHGLNVVEVPTGCKYHGLDRTSTHGPLRHGTSVVMSLVRLVVEKRPLVFFGYTWSGVYSFRDFLWFLGVPNIHHRAENSDQCSVGIISFHTDWIFHRFHRYNPLCHNKISRKNDEVVNETNFD